MIFVIKTERSVLTVCFTKADVHWDKTNLIGIQLAGFGLSEENKLHQEAMKEFSKEIEKNGIDIVGEKTATWWGKDSPNYEYLKCF